MNKWIPVNYTTVGLVVMFFAGCIVPGAVIMPFILFALKGVWFPLSWNVVFEPIWFVSLLFLCGAGSYAFGYILYLIEGRFDED